jgi:hypothetical protein
MKVVRNKTRKPIRVPLGQGKVLFLGPGKTGNVSPQAVEREAFVKLIDQGEIELLADGESGGGEGTRAGRVHESTHGNTQRRIQRTGDR